MSEKLSQSEIDALIASVQEGADVNDLMAHNKEEYKPYDFDRPSKFSIDNLRSLETIATSFAKSLSQNVVVQLRSSMQIEYKSIEQVPFVSDYADTVTKDYFAFAVVDLGHQDLNQIVFEFDLSFIMALHRKWLGREMPAELPARKPLTNIEVYSLKKLLESIVFETLENSFSNVATLNPKFVTYESDAQLLKVTSSSDMCVLISFDVKTEYWETTMRMVIPFLSIEAIINKFTTENIRELQPNKKKKSYRKEIEKGLEKVEEDVRISLGNISISLSDLSQLEVDDVLRLENKLSEPSKGHAAGIPKFHCVIGKDGNKKAYKFLGFINDDNTREEMES